MQELGVTFTPRDGSPPLAAAASFFQGKVAVLVTAGPILRLEAK